MAIRINSSLVPEDKNASDDLNIPGIIHTPIPSDIKWPQWVDGMWQEYSADNDPMVIATKELEASYFSITES